MEETTLFETEHYAIVLTTDSPEDGNNTVYGIKNKETNVIEYKDSIYTRTYFAIGNFEENHERMLKDMRGEDLIEISGTGDVAPTLVQ